ncbi:hypothetical protein EDB19DRAFT_1688175 [Suillus lakei]|nr:hypothetical protein EDB19DRAFT_1688175 [Suillus lakei]
MFYTRRPPTLSINELNHILSESLDIDRFEHVNVPETILHHDPLPSTPEKSKSSTFHRLFSRSSTHLPLVPHSPTNQVEEPVTPSPRKMAFTWRLSRLSPHRSRRAEDHAVEGTASVPSNRSRSSSVTSAVLSPSRALTSMSSTSSLGSVVPTSERFSKHLAEEIVYTETGNVALGTRKSPSSSPVATAHSRLFPMQLAHFPPAPRSPLQLLFGNKSSSSIVPNTCRGATTSADVMEKRSDASATECNVVESTDDDITPRATEFAISSHRRSDSTVQAKTRRRPSALTLVLPQEIASLCLQPAIGVSPHVPSDTEGSISVCSLPSPTSSIPTSCQPSSYVPSVSSSALASSTCSTKSATSTTSSFPWSRARAGSRSMLTPPLPGPPPSSPLPPLPTLTVQDPDVFTPSNAPVPLPTATPSKRTRTPVRTSSPSGTVAIPPSPGSLRLPSRLSWGATGRIVVPLPSSLPSPPSSPSKVGRKRELSPCSPIKNQKHSMSNTNAASPTLGKRASIGILEAASDLEAQVRRTKSILVLGNRRSKATISCSDSPPKRVQIHAEANPDTESPPKKPRRKSSAACTIPFLVVPRERRRSAPLLRSGTTSQAMPISSACADWTLSLPFCIDIPGGGICVPTPPSEDGALHEADEALQEAQGDDWTLSLGVDRQNLTMAGKGVASHSPQAKDSAEEQISATAQLPTPSTTPEPEDDTPAPPLPALFAPFPRPDSPASLGPHGGGLDLDGGCGKRGSGWDVCGWFGLSGIDEPQKEDTRPASMLHSEASWIRRSCDTDAPRRSDVGFARRSREERIRSLSEDSTTTTCTADTLFYSARTSMLVI